jgi:hypothetical protein
MARPRGHYLNPDRLTEYMEATGKLLTTVAEEAELTRTALSGLMGQHHAASLPVAHQLANSTGIPVGSLFPTLSPRWAPAKTLVAV